MATRSGLEFFCLMFSPHRELLSQFILESGPKNKEKINWSQILLRESLVQMHLKSADAFSSRAPCRVSNRACVTVTTAVQ
jgi:hypothetical protein